jgi:hypothetical protein
MDRTMSATAVRKLMRRALLSVDPKKSIAIKRDVHEYRVETDAARFADAFRAVMIDPEGDFGLIRVKRPAERMGKDYQIGERFQGCYSLEKALLAAVSRPWVKRLVARVLALKTMLRFTGWLEDELLSDYAIIDRLVLSPDAARGEVHTLRYRYLSGTPIAGSSAFYIEPSGSGCCLVRQVFEFQEINFIALTVFQRAGLKMHDQVVHMQILKAAVRAGAPPPVGTIPVVYTRP